MLKDRIKQKREEMDISQIELAEHLSVSQQTIGSWEVGRTAPSHETLNALAGFFNVSVDYLLGRTNDPSPPYQKWDDETLEIMERVHKDPNLRILFSSSKNLKKEEVEAVVRMVKAFKGED